MVPRPQDGHGVNARAALAVVLKAIVILQGRGRGHVADHQPGAARRPARPPMTSMVIASQAFTEPKPSVMDTGPAMIPSPEVPTSNNLGGNTMARKRPTSWLGWQPHSRPRSLTFCDAGRGAGGGAPRRRHRRRRRSRRKRRGRFVPWTTAHNAELVALAGQSESSCSVLRPLRGTTVERGKASACR